MRPVAAVLSVTNCAFSLHAGPDHSGADTFTYPPDSACSRDFAILHRRISPDSIRAFARRSPSWPEVSSA